MDEKKQRAPRSDTALLQACLDGNLDIVRKRIAAGAHVNAGRKDKRPPLETAARCGHLDIVRELIAAGADVNQIAKINFEASPGSALIGAIKQNHLETAQELVRAGASVVLETHPGCNAASEAAFKAIELYWSKNSSLKSVVQALESLGELEQKHSFQDWFDFLKQTVKARAKVNDYCLWEACKLGCTPVVHYLVSVGSNVNFMPHDTTPLQIAIHGGFDEIALALISAKADPNLTGKFSPSPLKLAVAKERHTIIRALLDAGATPLDGVLTPTVL